MKREHNVEQYVPFSQEDISLDMENNIAYAMDPTGKMVAVDTWKYAIYFFDKIQRKDISKEPVFIDGIRLDKYVEIFKKENHAQNMAYSNARLVTKPSSDWLIAESINSL